MKAESEKEADVIAQPKITFPNFNWIIPNNNRWGKERDKQRTKIKKDRQKKKKEKKMKKIKTKTIDEDGARQ